MGTNASVSRTLFPALMRVNQFKELITYDEKRIHHNAKGELQATKGALQATNGELQATKGALQATNGELQATNFTGSVIRLES
jgi:hypothetical protein